MTEILNEIVPIGVVLTFIGTLFGIYYTRKNLTTFKYIDIITSERIRWIEKLRDDLSLLTSWIIIFISNNKDLNELIEAYDELKEQDAIENPHEDEPMPMTSKGISDNLMKQTYLSNELKGISRQRIIEKIYLIKLRLNPNDDLRAIELLDNLLEYFTPPVFDKQNYDLIEKGIKEFVLLSQQILKNEWDKVKIETKKGPNGTRIPNSLVQFFRRKP